MTTEGIERQEGHWFNVKDVSGGHSAVTVSVSGFSLAVFSIFIIFNPNEAKNILTNRNIIYSLQFFFTSLVFGIIASFQYSVLSGDERSRFAQEVSFLAPSVAFGISILTLFYGFYLFIPIIFSSITFVLFYLLFIHLIVWSTGVIVTRTTLTLIKNISQDMPNKHLNESVATNVSFKIFTILVVSKFILLLIGYNKHFFLQCHIEQFSFYYVLFLGLIVMLYYAKLSGDIQPKKRKNSQHKIEMSTINSNNNSVNVLSWVYILFITFFVYIIILLFCFV